jgi:hypothetical protein
VGVGKGDSQWKGTEDNVSQLDAARWYHVTEGEVIFAEKLWEIVKENEEESQSTTIQVSGSMLQVGFLQERGQELEQRQ